MSDGGMQWWAEVGQYEQERREADRDARLIEAHREWVHEFNNQENEHGTANQEG